MAHRVAFLGGGDWLEPFRVHNGLDRDLRPIGRPDVAPMVPRMPTYRNFVYGAVKFVHVVIEGHEESVAKPLPGRGPGR